jgi:hypothetical protein
MSRLLWKDRKERKVSRKMSDKKSDLQNLPACVVEFVKQLLKKMRYRRKVRLDVRAEFAAHFEDELKDCATGRERDQKARRLIADFGDLKLLAILLRRAKKRCRPLWRTVVARAFQAIGVLILCFIFYAIWFSSGRPTISTDYLALLNQMNQPEVRDENNAWPHYEKAISLYVPQTPAVERCISYRRDSRKREEAIRLKGLLGDNQQEVLEWTQKNQKHWDSLSPEQQAVILKCFEYDWVPFPETAYQVHNDWQVTTLPRMTEHIIRSIKENTELTVPHPRGGLPGSERPGFPRAELKDWLKHRTIPPNYFEAVSVAVLREAGKWHKDLPRAISAPLTDVENEYIGPWISQNEAAWQEFAAGSRKPYCYRPYACDPKDEDKSVWTILLPHLRALRHLAWLGMWRSRMDRSQGRIQQGIEECFDVARAGNHWQLKGVLVEHLVGLGISSLGRREILYILENQRVPASELEHLQHQLSQIYAEGYPFMDIEGERLAFLDMVQRSFTDGGPGGGHLTPMYWPEWTDSRGTDQSERKLLMPIFTAASMVHARRDATVAKANQIYDRLSKLAKMTPYERHISDLEMGHEMIMSAPKYRFFLIEIFLPAMGRVSELAYRGKVLHEATLTILALKRWRLEKDEYPPALRELVSAGYLKELPMDPFSDKPLVYRRTDDDFILYSSGYNFKDDGGEHGRDRRGEISKWADNGDRVFWPLPKPQAAQ